MSLLKRIEKLEQKLKPKRPEIYWLMWRNCQWREAEGFIRGENESKEQFQARISSKVNKQFIWVK